MVCYNFQIWHPTPRLVENPRSPGVFERVCRNRMLGEKKIMPPGCFFFAFLVQTMSILYNSRRFVDLGGIKVCSKPINQYLVGGWTTQYHISQNGFIFPQYGWTLKNILNGPPPRICNVQLKITSTFSVDVWYVANCNLLMISFQWKTSISNNLRFLCGLHSGTNRKNGGKGRLYLTKKTAIVEGLYILYKLSKKKTQLNFVTGNKMVWFFLSH